MDQAEKGSFSRALYVAKNENSLDRHFRLQIERYEHRMQLSLDFISFLIEENSFHNTELSDNKCWLALFNKVKIYLTLPAIKAI